MKRKPQQQRGKLPDNPKGREASRNYAAYAEENFAAEGHLGKSLLRNVFGAIRCQSPQANSLLGKLIKERQGVYAALLGRIMLGSSLTSASITCGLNRATTQQWLSQGLSDQLAERDTYYSRFASDVYAALAHGVSEAEVAIHRHNPAEYLKTGPGRALYRDEQYWQPALPGQAPIDDINPLVTVADEGQSTLQDNRMLDALKVLQGLGMVDTEFTKQLSEQSGQRAEVVNMPPVDTSTVVVAPSASVPIDTVHMLPWTQGMDRSMRSEPTSKGPVPPASIVGTPTA